MKRISGGVTAEVAKVTEVTQASTVKQKEAYVGLYKSVDAARADFVKSQILANELVTKSLVTNAIKAQAELKAIASTPTIGRGTSQSAGPISDIAGVRMASAEEAALLVAQSRLLAEAEGTVAASTARATEASVAHSLAIKAEAAAIREQTAVAKSLSLTRSLHSDTDKLVAQSEREIQRTLKLASGAAVEARTAELALAEGTSAAGGAASSAAAQFFGLGAGAVEMTGPIGIAAIALAAIAATGVVVAGQFFEIAKAASEFQGQLFDLSQQTGLSIETLSTLQVLSKTSGGDITALSQAVVLFQTKLDEAQDPVSKAAAKFREFGIETNDTESALRQTLKALAAMPEGFAQTTAATDFFGKRAGKQFLAVLKEAHGDLDGVTRRLRELGVVISTEDAKAADQFNDQLAVLGFQFRALEAQITKESIPAILDAIKETSRFLKDNREAVSQLGQAVSVLARLLNFELRGALAVINGLWNISALHLVAEAYERIQRAVGKIIPSVAPSSTASGTAQAGPGSFTGTETDKGLRTGLQEMNEQTAAFKAQAEEQRRIANQKVADAETAFAAGKITRRKETEDIIAAAKIKRDADIDEAFRERAKLQFRKIIEQDPAKQKELEAQITEINTKEANARAAFDIDVQQRRSELRSKERADLIEHHKALLAIELSAGQTRIALIESRVTAGLKTEEQGESERAAIENTGFAARKRVLQNELREAGVEAGVKIKDELKALEEEITANKQAQALRRTDISRKAGQEEIDALLKQADLVIQLGQASDEARITSLRALAVLRVNTEEQAERAILKIRLDAIQREADAIAVQQTAAGAIADPTERGKREAELNGQFRILAAQRKAIQGQGNQDIEAARQSDLQNEKHYAEELLRIERETAQLGIDLMVFHNARRIDVITSQSRLDIADENRRHQNAVDRLRKEKADNKLIEAEEERHRLALKIINDRAARDKALAGPAGALLGGLQSGQLPELQNGIQSFADAATVAFGAVGAAVNGLAQGVGALVQNWVLMGETGPNAMRKLVASVLAGLAAQAAIQAIMEVAYGLIALTPWGAAIYGPASNHFIAAALFASVAGAAAIAGRGIAGDAFKQNTAPGSSSTGSGGSGGSTPKQTALIDIGRRTGAAQPQINIHLHGDLSQFDVKVVDAVANNWNRAGKIMRVAENNGVLVPG